MIINHLKNEWRSLQNCHKFLIIECFQGKLAEMRAFSATLIPFLNLKQRPQAISDSRRAMTISWRGE